MKKNYTFLRITRMALVALMMGVMMLTTAEMTFGQVFVPDGNYSATEYDGAQSESYTNVNGSCGVYKALAIIHEETDGSPYLLLGMQNGNGESPFLDFTSILMEIPILVF